MPGTRASWIAFNLPGRSCARHKPHSRQCPFSKLRAQRWGGEATRTSPATVGTRRRPSSGIPRLALRDVQLEGKIWDVIILAQVEGFGVFCYVFSRLTRCCRMINGIQALTTSVYFPFSRKSSCAGEIVLGHSQRKCARWREWPAFAWPLHPLPGAGRKGHSTLPSCHLPSAHCLPILPIDILPSGEAASGATGRAEGPALLGDATPEQDCLPVGRTRWQEKGCQMPWRCLCVSHQLGGSRSPKWAALSGRSLLCPQKVAGTLCYRKVFKTRIALTPWT